MQRPDFEVSAGLDLSETIGLLWRYRKVILGTILASVLLALMWIAVQTPTYTATSIVQVSPQQQKVLADIESVLSGGRANSMAMESEVDILRSPSMAGRVVNMLALDEVPEFNENLRSPSLAGRLLAFVFFWQDATNKRPGAVLARTHLLENVEISRNPRSLTIQIAADSADPALAARIATTYAKAYITEQIEGQFAATRQANTWLSSQLVELREKLKVSAQAVQAYREKHDLYESQGLTLSDQQLSELNSELIMARTDRAAAQAELQRARQLMRTGGAASAAEVLKSTLIQKLREQEAEVQRRAADLATRYGPKHPEMLKIKAQQTDIQAKIEQEIQSILANYENRLAIARTRERALEQQLKQATQQAGTASAAEIGLSELLREQEANRALYNSFLGRSKETAQQQDLAQAEARIVSEAPVPLEPAHPQAVLILVVSLFAGGFFGILLALVLAQFDRTLRTAAQLEKQTGFPALGSVPLVKQQTLVSYLRAKPTSFFAESLRKVLSALYFANPQQPPQVIMVTSSVVGEGKSTLVLAMAQMAQMDGRRVVIVETDMRRPSLAKDLEITPDHVLQDYLTRHTKLQDVIFSDAVHQLDVIPAGVDEGQSNRLLGSDEMSAFLAALRAEYDLVLLDTAPVGALVDALSLAQKVDGTVFVVRWGKTALDVVQDALKFFKVHQLPLLGLVLTQVDLEQDETYGYGGYYKTYSAYYHD